MTKQSGFRCTLSAACSAVFAVTAVAVGLLPLTLGANDWPQWRGPDHNGISRESGWFEAWPDAGPTPAWTAQVGTGFSSIAVRNGRVFTMGNEDDVDTVFCLDAATGKSIWTHSYPCDLQPRYYEGGPSATPTVHNGRVFTFSKMGHVFALDESSGEVLWSRNLREEYDLELPEWGFAGSPLIHGDLVVFNAGSAGIALDRHTGETVWRSSSERAGYATPVPFQINGLEAIAIFSAKALVAVKPDSGEILWKAPWDSARDINAADPIVSDNRIFISSEAGCALLEVSATDAEVLWQHKERLQTYFNPPVLIDGYLYAIDGTTHSSSHLTALDFNTGEIAWSEPGFGNGGVLGAGDKLLLLDRGKLMVVKATPKSFTSLARAQIMGGKCWTAPTLANGRIYGRNADGHLVCIDLND